MGVVAGVLGLGELGAVKKAIQKNISDFVYISIGITQLL